VRQQRCSTRAHVALLQVAIKCAQLGVSYLAIELPLEAMLSEEGRIDSAQFVQVRWH
jgi:hypothetical protein